MKLSVSTSALQWARTAGTRLGFGTDFQGRKDPGPAVKYENHKRNAHSGKHDSSCNACKELKGRVK